MWSTWRTGRITVSQFRSCPRKNSADVRSGTGAFLSREWSSG
jgi:hypothetical protein